MQTYTLFSEEQNSYEEIIIITYTLEITFVRIRKHIDDFIYISDKVGPIDLRFLECPQFIVERCELLLNPKEAEASDVVQFCSCI